MIPGERSVYIQEGQDRLTNIGQVLDSMAETLVPQLTAADKVVIKPNFLSARRLAASTNPETLETVVAWVRHHYSGDIIVAEGSRAITEYLDKYQVLARLQPHRAQFLNTNTDEAEWLEFTGKDHENKDQQIRYSKTAAESFLISLSVPKMHANAGATMGIKNLMGLLHPKDRKIVHGFSPTIDPEKRQLLASPKWEKDTQLGEFLMKLFGLYVRIFGQKAFSEAKKMALAENYALISQNLHRMATIFHPDLTVLDAYQVMAGEGPWFGIMITVQAALASLDYLAADVTAARLMELNPLHIGYLHHLLQDTTDEEYQISYPMIDVDKIKHQCDTHSHAIFQRLPKKEGGE